MQEIPTHLILRYFSNQATTAEVDELLKWVSSDKRHQKFFSEWMEVWDAKGALESTFDVAEGLFQLNERINAEEKGILAARQSFLWWKVAASIVFFISVTAAAIFSWSNQNLFEGYMEYKNVTDKVQTLRLADGSRVTLNIDASIRYPENFNEGKRQVLVTGEVFFEVKRDTIHPFLVHTDEIRTEVLGTSFNIQSLNDQTIVTVATGKVKVSTEAESVLLLPNEKITYSTVNQQLRKEGADTDNELTWRYPVLLFQDTRLHEVANQIRDHYNVEVTFEKEALGNCLITGKFKNLPLNKILEAISFSTGIQIHHTGNNYILQGKGC